MTAIQRAAVVVMLITGHRGGCYSYQVSGGNKMIERMLLAVAWILIVVCLIMLMLRIWVNNKKIIGSIMKHLIEFLIRRFLPGYHLHRDPVRIKRANWHINIKGQTEPNKVLTIGPDEISVSGMAENHPTISIESQQGRDIAE